MKKILVPVDFSDNSENALEYACELGKKLNAEVFILHSYHVPVPVSEVVILPMPEEYHKIAMNGLTRAKDKAKERFPEVNMVIHAAMGSADLEIPAYANNIKADLIIMGTHGASGVSEFLIGSNAASVMENSLVPVLAIPEKAKFKELKKIAFAADYGNHNAGHVHFLIDLAKIFDSEIIMLHITSGNLEDNFEDLEIGRFKEYLVKESGYKNISYRLIEDKDVFHGLNTYLLQFPPDMLAMSMRNRSFAQKIFSRSLTKRMAYHGHIPVLALHITK